MRHLTALLIVFFFAATATAGDWLQFRGSEGTAISKSDHVPVRFNDGENLIWKKRLPGPGSSSPIVVGDRLFLTCYTGYGLDQKDPGKRKNLVRHLLCFDRNTGEQLWQRSVKNTGNVALYTQFMPQHGYATPTPASDGKSVYAFFDTSGVHAYDLTGKPLWNGNVGEGFHGWGCGGSPVLLGKQLIINAAIENGDVVALDKSTGKRIWRGKNIYSSFSTPVLVKLPNGKRELVVSMLRKLVAIDPDNGKRLWTFNTNRSYGVTCPVAHGGKVFAVTQSPTRLVAIAGGQRGKLDDSHLAWSARGVSTGIGSPLLVGKYLFAMSRGILSCVHAETGKIQYRQRTGVRGRYYASPIAVGKAIYFVSRTNGVLVFAADPKFKMLSHNKFAADESVFNGTPAVSGNRLYLRSDRYLYCVGKK